jgi:hypothetical protein
MNGSLKRFSRLGHHLFLALMVAAFLQPLQAQTNPNQAATLHWYGAITNLSYLVAGAYGVAFDGASMWVASYNSYTLTKFRASDGAVLLQTTLSGAAYQLAYDGANIWAALGNSNTVTKVRASDGVVLGTYAVGHDAFGVAFDGTNIPRRESIRVNPKKCFASLEKNPQSSKKTS